MTIYILGGGPSLPEAVKRIPEGSTLFGVGNAWKFAKLDYWTSGFPGHYKERDRLNAWDEETTYLLHPFWARKCAHRRLDVVLVPQGGSVPYRCDYFNFTRMDYLGNSGCNAAQMAIALGYTKLILLGIDGPAGGKRMENADGYWDNQPQPNNPTHEEHWRTLGASLPGGVKIIDWSDPGYGIFPCHRPQKLRNS